MKWVDYVWSNCGLPTPEPLSIFGKFSTMWVFMGNKFMSSIDVKIARFFLFQPLLQLWHRSWASHKQGDTPALELQTSDSENRDPSSWWPWWWQSVARLTGSAAPSSSIQGQHQRGRASHRVIFSRGNSDAHQAGTAVWLGRWLWLLFVPTPVLSLVPEISQWFCQMPGIFFNC